MEENDAPRDGLDHDSPWAAESSPARSESARTEQDEQDEQDEADAAVRRDLTSAKSVAGTKTASAASSSIASAASPSVANAVPRRLGRYFVFETLGQGGMGTIQLALVGGLGRFRKLVVLKVLRDELTRDPKFIEMFMREAALAACLSHPNVVQTVEAGQAEGRYFLVMEFLDGQPLSKLLRTAHRDPSVPLALRLQVICDALAGLHYAHELCGYDGRALHMVHRDVSPPNLFITYDGQVKLLDFGIANARDGEGSHPGEFKGKLGYAAPEQLQGQPADRRIDVFAAGVVLWEAIALRHFAQGKPTRHTFAARLSGTEARIAQQVPDVDRALAAICDRAMHLEPAERYPTAESFRLALQSYLVERQQALDAAAIGEFMRTKFADERAAMHRLIDTQLREGPDAEEPVSTPITDWPRFATRLRGAAERPREVRGESAGLDQAVVVRAQGQRPVVRKLVATGVVLLALAGAWWALRHASTIDQTAGGGTLPVPGTSTGAQASPAVPAAPPVEPEPAAPGARAERPGHGAAPALEGERADERSRTSPTSRRVRAAVGSGRPAPATRVQRPRSAQRLSARAPEGTPRPSATSEVRPARGDSAPAIARTGGEARARASAAQTRDAGADELDLHSVPRRERRPLDLSNPFR